MRKRKALVCMYCSRFVVRAVPVRGVAGWRSLGVLPRSRGASDVSSDVKPRSGEIWRPAAPHALIPFSLLERGTARATCLRPLSVVAVERLRISTLSALHVPRTGPDLHTCNVCASAVTRATAALSSIAALRAHAREATRTAIPLTWRLSQFRRLSAPALRSVRRPQTMLTP